MFSYFHINSYNAEMKYKPWRTKVVFQFDYKINVLVGFFRIHLNTYVMGPLPL